MGLNAIVSALLGPTNTGKTYRAIQRMLAHKSGMMGLPLRLLAREVYDRVVAETSADQVALITGEEKVVGASARYFICTVEAMPLDRPVSFLAVDEIQLCADAQRGHVFTDRLLNARGLRETLFLGADTIAPLLSELLPDAEVYRAPRLSKLSHAGTRKLKGLPPRTAVVAFSAREVYELAERLKGRRGGTAVVLGALSPRTRNAQVELYQSGQVQYLVATDAIGMGLNMDIDHVALAALRKFDGRSHRALTPAEVGQIAGRAGRWRKDGTFGSINRLGPLDPELVEAVERHDFKPISRLYWRNSRLDFRSPTALLASLGRRSPHRALKRVQDEDDRRVLEALSTRDVAALADTPERVELLWDVCQIPDYRKTLTGSHADLLEELATQLLTVGRLDRDLVAKRIGRLDNPMGDIDTLMGRIAFVRTWTYISFRSDWLDDATGWQARTRAIEDRLSDALHEQLTRRFVDQRGQIFGGPRPTVEVHVEEDGRVLAQGQELGRLKGLAFVPSAGGWEREVRRALVPAMQARLDALPDFSIDPAGRLWAGELALGRLVAGESPLSPSVRVARLEWLTGAQRQQLQARAEDFLRQQIELLLGPLAGDRQGMRPQRRGLLWQLEQSLGTLEVRAILDQMRALSKGDRRALGKLGVRLGTRWVYVASMLTPEAIRHRVALWTVHAGLDRPPVVPEGPCVRVGREVPRGFWPAVGYAAQGGWAVRVDVFEEVAAAIRARRRRRQPGLPRAVPQLLECDVEQAREIVRRLSV